MKYPIYNDKKLTNEEMMLFDDLYEQFRNEILMVLNIDAAAYNCAFDAIIEIKKREAKNNG